MRLGMSQKDLARVSKVSLPMIQIIESGKANPSLKVLERLSSVLDFEIKITAKHSSLEILGMGLGLLESEKLSVKFNSAHFTDLLLESFQEFRTTLDSRLKDVFLAVWLCTTEYFPSIAANISKQIPISTLNPDGRLIKLKRIALPHLIEVLKR